MTKLIIYGIIFAIWVIVEAVSRSKGRPTKGARPQPRPQARPQAQQVSQPTAQGFQRPGDIYQAGGPGYQPQDRDYVPQTQSSNVRSSDSRNQSTQVPQASQAQQLQDIFRQLQGHPAHQTPTATPRPQSPPPIPAAMRPVEPPRSQDVVVNESIRAADAMRAELDRQRKAKRPKPTTIADHADSMGRSAQGHAARAWEKTAPDVEDISEHLVAQGFDAPLSKILAPRRRVNLSRESLINAVILGEVLGRRGGLANDSR